MSVATSIHDLKVLVLSFHPIVVVETVEEERVSQLLLAVSRELGLPLFEWTITRGLGALPRSDDPDLAGHATEPLELLLRLENSDEEAIYHLKDFCKHLDGPAAVRQLRDVAKRFARSRSCLVLSGRRCELPEEVAHQALHFDLRLPTPDELRPMLRHLLRSLERNGRVRVDLDAEQQAALLRALSGLTLNQARQAVARAALDDSRLDASDVERILAHKASLLRQDGLLEYLPAEDNAFELGGFERLQAWLDRARTGFGAEARALDLTPPRGVLLVGVQGCGKSLAAKCIARRWGFPLLKLEAGRLYDKYVGETEKNFRKATELAESMAPVVLWIDELEKAFAPTGGGEADGGLSRRVFGAFLTWLQEKDAAVFVAATANDLSLLPPELLRKGRFDEIFFVDLPEPDARRAIFGIHLRRHRQDPSRFDLEALVRASDGMSGAEIEQAVISSLYESLHRAEPLDSKTLLTEVNAIVPLSVARAEAIGKLRELGRSRFVPVR